jgi:hypothetical protein
MPRPSSQKVVSWTFLMSAILCGGLVPSKTQADFVTGTVSSSDGNLSAEADFTLGSGTITITIKNLQADIVSVGQTISGLSFAVSAPPASSFTLISTAGQLVDVANDGTGTLVVNTGSGLVDGSGTTTYSGTTGGTPLADGRWHLTSSDPPPSLIALGGGQPDHLVLGPPNSSGNYTDSNGSFNGQFNPFFENSVTLVLSAPGATSSSTISNVVFNFGTGVNEHTAPGFFIPPVGPHDTATPVPPSVVLFGLGFVGFLVRSRRRLIAAA